MTQPASMRTRSYLYGVDKVNGFDAWKFFVACADGDLDRGAATDLPGDEPWATPLAWARRRGLENIAALLAKHGATV